MVTTVSATLRGFLKPFALHLRETGWRVEAAAAGASADPTLGDVFDRVHDLPLSRSLRDLPSLIRGARATGVVVSEVGPDIVHVHTPIASFLTRFAVRRMPAGRRPLVVYTAHGFHFHSGGPRLVNLLFLTAERIAGRWTDRLIVINDEDEAAARRHRIVPERHLVRMPGIGLDTSWYAPTNARDAVVEGSGATHAAAAGSSSAVPYFVLVGEFSANKRQADAVAALASMRHGDARLVLLGDGVGRGRVEAIAQDLGVSDRVDFAGLVDDVRPIVEGAVALLNTSHREGLNRSVMEALALEVPVIASTARGNAELVGDAGVVVAVGDVRGLAEAMDRLIDAPDERRELGRRGRQRMIERYDIATVLGLHDRLYESLLAERRATSR